MSTKDYKRINETIINGSRVYIENGEVKTELNENIKRTGFMSVDDAMKLTIEKIKKIYALKDGSVEELAERLDCVTAENTIERLN